MKIWYDACTGKHIRYGAAIARRLRGKGHDVILTTRRHPGTIKLAEYLGEKFHPVGKYDPSTKTTKLRESLKRQIQLYKMFKNEKPDIAVSHQSVELCRVAFGFGIPIISTHDAPHAEAVNRLTLPLIDVAVISKAIPRDVLLNYGVREIRSFEGVDEVAWTKNFEPTTEFDYDRPLIVVRQMEIKAAYAEGEMDVTESLAKELTTLGNVVFLTRYERKSRAGLIVPRGFIDSISLAAQAALVVGVGGTLAREAALMGTPSIVIPTFGRSYVNEYLSTMGFPLYIVDVEKVLEYARQLIGRKYDVKSLLEKLENPVDVIENVLEEFEN